MMSMHATVYKIVLHEGVHVVLKERTSIECKNIIDISNSQFSIPSLRIKRTANGPIDILTREVY
jgi:hypothetical protein